MRPHGQQQALARRRQEQEQLALDRRPARVLAAGETCPICGNADGWWLDDENPPVFEPCWAHEQLPDHVRKEAPRR